MVGRVALQGLQLKKGDAEEEGKVKGVVGEADCALKVLPLILAPGI